MLKKSKAERARKSLEVISRFGAKRVKLVATKKKLPFQRASRLSTNPPQKKSTRLEKTVIEKAWEKLISTPERVAAKFVNPATKRRAMGMMKRPRRMFMGIAFLAL